MSVVIWKTLTTSIISSLQAYKEVWHIIQNAFKEEDNNETQNTNMIVQVHGFLWNTTSENEERSEQHRDVQHEMNFTEWTTLLSFKCNQDPFHYKENIEATSLLRLVGKGRAAIFNFHQWVTLDSFIGKKIPFLLPLAKEFPGHPLLWARLIRELDAFHFLEG